MHRDNNNSREAHYSSKQTTALVNSATSVGKANLSPTEFIASKREAYYALHRSSNVTRFVSSHSKIQYRNDNFSDWLAEANHVAHIELSGPIFGGSCKRMYFLLQCHE